MLERQTPYTIKRVRMHWHGNHDYNIFFEDTKIREIDHCPQDVAEQFVFLLNTAWNLGYMSGQVQTGLAYTE